MSNEKPKDLKIGCTTLYVGVDNANGYITSTNGDLLEVSRKEARLAGEWLLQFADYEEPKWVPDVADVFRMKHDDEKYMRVSYDHPRFSQYGDYSFTAVSLEDGRLTWWTKTSNDLVQDERQKEIVNMDPNQTFYDLLCSIRSCDYESAQTELADLIDWLDNDGFEPAALVDAEELALLGTQ